MPLRALKTVSKAQNGVGAFILQCKRLDFHYCNWAGSSRGMNTFLQTQLLPFSKRNPGIEIRISPRPGKHPLMRGTYVNGREKSICVRNMTPAAILEKATLLRDASGEKLKKSMRAGRNTVMSGNESVRGVWDIYHGGKFKI